MYGLDLFSGIGGIAQALAPWVETVAYCERERYAQAVLLSRMERGEIDSAPIWDDVTTLKGSMLPRIDIITGGFPCQDLSLAGNRAGLAGERSGLFFQIVRLVRELEPSFIFMENVPGIFAGDAIGTVNGELAALGYDCRWGVLSAYDVGAPHKRERWFCLAHAGSGTRDKRFELGSNGRKDKAKQARMGSQDVADTNSEGPQGHGKFSGGGGGGIHEGESEGSLGQSGLVLAHAENRGPLRGDRSLQYDDGVGSKRADNKRGTQGNDGWQWWELEPAVGRVAHGIPARIYRLKCLGNGVVPQQVEEAFKRLAGLATTEEPK